MNILDKVQEIFNQYELKPIELPPDFKNVYMFLRKYREFSNDFKSIIDDCDKIRLAISSSISIGPKGVSQIPESIIEIPLPLPV
jgi:hypothetical protein